MFLDHSGWKIAHNGLIFFTLPDCIITYITLTIGSRTYYVIAKWIFKDDFSQRREALEDYEKCAEMKVDWG